MPVGRNDTGRQRLQWMNRYMRRGSWDRISESWRNRICYSLLGIGISVFPHGALSQLSSPSAPVSQSANQDEGSFTPDRNRPTEQDQATPETTGDPSLQEDESQSEQTKPSMSADQMIAILDQDPVLMQSIKDQIAQQTSADPKSITDDSLFERIRQSSSVRDSVTCYERTDGSRL
jgi:hypothetical protein